MALIRTDASSWDSSEPNSVLSLSPSHRLKLHIFLAPYTGVGKTNLPFDGIESGREIDSGPARNE